MTDWAREQTRALANITLAGDREILAALRQSTKDLGKQLAEITKQDAFSSKIRREQLLRVKRALLLEQASIFDQAEDTIRAQRVRAAARAIEINGLIDQVAFRAAGQADLGRALTRALVDGAGRSLETVVNRMQHSQRPLSERVYKAKLWANDIIDSKINSALLRGLSAREFAAEARDWIRPDTPGGVRFAALRLSRTEINNAAHAASVHNASMKPWVTGMTWHLSKSHGRPDRCNDLDGETFKPADVPAKPHPQCFCVVVQEVEDDDLFIKHLLDGRYDSAIDAHLPGR